MAFKKGYKQSPEHRKRLSDALKRGQFVPCITCGKDFWSQPNEQNPNPKRKRKPRVFCSVACRWKMQKRERHPLAKRNPVKGLRVRALIRDNWTCVQCSFSDKEIMQADHIVERADGGAHTLENLQTLCPNCHARKSVASQKRRVKMNSVV